MAVALIFSLVVNLLRGSQLWLVINVVSKEKARVPDWWGE